MGEREGLLSCWQTESVAQNAQQTMQDLPALLDCGSGTTRRRHHLTISTCGASLELY